MSPIDGHSAPWNRVRRRLAATIFSFSSRKAAVSGASWANAFTTRIPLKFSCALADSALNCACTWSNRRWISRPRAMNRMVTIGRMMIVHTVSHTSIHSMNATETTSMTAVWQERIRPTPANRCTARMSLTARAIRSPVLAR